MPRTRVVALGIIAILIAGVCVRLGLWQLDRLHERRRDNARIAAGIAGAPVEIEAIGGDSTRSRALRVRVRGEYDFDNEIVLINRSRDGAPGVHLLTPVRLAGRDTAVLVNRGWVYSADGATVDPARWREPVAAGGLAYVSWLPTSGTMPSVQPSASSSAAASNRRVRQAARDAVAGLVPYPIAPYQLILLDSTAIADAGAAYGGAGAGPMGTGDAIDTTRPVRIPLPALDEGPHKSYVIQWFAFAAIALVGTATIVRKEWARGEQNSAL